MQYNNVNMDDYYMISMMFHDQFFTKKLNKFY